MSTQASADRLLREAVSLAANLVDPLDAVRGERGEMWGEVGGGMTGTEEYRPYVTESELTQVRNRCRWLSTEVEYAISAHANRISYIVGTGHVYTVANDAAKVRGIAQGAIDRFVESAEWGRRQQEAIFRFDRDGECIQRTFPAGPDQGYLRVRFVEPDWVANPPGATAEQGWHLGVQTDPRDCETVLNYCIAGEIVPASQIQHRKANADASMRRGLPLLYPVRRNLERAEKLLRNMTTVSTVQAAIAMIRKHQSNPTGVSALATLGTISRTNPYTGAKENVRQYAPGSILDVPATSTYEFPSIAVNAGALVAVLQAELRAICARLVMPEFMLTQDASNGNFASILVAEGPAVKNFEREQWSMIAWDRAILGRVLDSLVLSGAITAEERRACVIEAQPPTLVVRDRLADVQANQILLQSKIMDRKTWQMREGLDPAKVDAEIERDDLGGVGNIALPGLDAMAGVPQ